MATLLFSAVFFSATALFTEFTSSSYADSGSGSNSNSTLSVRIAKDYQDGNGLIDITTLSLDLSPNANGVFVKDDLDVIVTTTNETGYTLNIADNDTDTALHHTAHNSTATISTLPSGTTPTTYTEATFPVNTWGYSTEPITVSNTGTSTNNLDQAFSPIPASTDAATIKATTTATPTTGDTTKVTFAVKADTAIPAGTYQDSIVFTAIANYVPNNLERITNMQDMTPAVCKSANIGDTATLKDTRDNKTYTIRKLADGNCWMIKNLDLDLSTTTTLTNQDTNLKSKTSWTPQNSTQTTEGTVWAQDGGDVARSMDPGNIYFPNGVGTGTADANANLEGTTTGEPWEFIGNYYNWYAATAGTGTAAMTSGNATDSICPKGWKLPDNTGSKSFANLLSTYSIADNTTGATELLQAPLNFVRSGYYRWVNGQIYVKGANGHWWSTSATSATNTRYFFTDNASVKPHNSDVKGQGLSVRCVAEGTLDSISTMQDMTIDICAAAVTGETAILTDTRDGESYMIRKLADNNCWMVQNLALGGNSPITLTPADSNVSTNFTLSASSNSFGSTNDAAGIDINRMHDNGNTWLDGTTVNTSGIPPSQTQYMGNYYNWYTATAGSGTYAMGTQGDNALQSICPKGWRLPTGGAITSAGNGEFQQLYDAYGSYNDFMAATNTILSGYWYNLSSTHQGIEGYLWSSTIYGLTTVYGLYSDESIIMYNRLLDKVGGGSVRCIAENNDLTTISTMQQMTPSVCAATKTPSASETTVPENTLTDTRDNKTYTVRKLADGNCWMVKNLDLDLSTTVALNSTTSDLSPGRTWTPQNNTQTAVGTVWAQDGGDVARSFEPGEALYFPNGVGTGTADSYGNLTGSTSGQPWEHVGNYYNWYAATAGTGTAAMTDGNTATDSICPKGWKLPDNTGSKSFLNLVVTTYGITDDATGATKLLQAPLNFVRGGYYGWSYGQVYYKGASGIWWSTSAASATNAYDLNTSSTRVTPQNFLNKGLGLTVRCVAR